METRTLSNLYELPARNWGNKTAIADGLTSYSFNELHAMSALLAGEFIRRGVAKGDRIMVVAEKCCQMAIIAPAIWRAGAVYVPIDPLNPASRNEMLIASIEPVLIVLPLEKDPGYPLQFAGCPVFQLQYLLQCCAKAGDGDRHFPPTDRKDLAYIMHTSGSTGEPKGVMIEHGSVSDYFYNHNLVLGFTESSYCLSNAPFYFDVSIEDTFLPLSVGASVYQYRGLPISSLILNLMSKEGITHLIAVSTLLGLITGDGKRLAVTDLRKLELVMTGAEVCDTKVIAAWKSAAPHVKVFNVYGPTEATIVCTCYPIPHAEPGRTAFYPIGKPLLNVSAMLFDERMEVIPEKDKKGVLYIGGSQVMRGYWKDEALTGQVITTYGGQRFYRTGDICFWDGSGDLVFCGRNDDEIKLLGRRINLMEIKNKLLAFPFVKSAAIGIIAVEQKKALAAVIVVDSDADVGEVLNIRAGLSQELPLYMIPEFFAIKNTPAVSKTGKHDEKSIFERFERHPRADKGNYYLVAGDFDFVPLTL